MKATKEKYFIPAAGSVSLLLAILLWLASPAMAKDTDIYAVNAKQNCYILLDNSGSMAFGVYENNIDYGQMYLYLLGLGVTDPTNLPAINPTPFPKNKIYLLKGSVGVAVKNGVTMSGDPGDPSIEWDFGSIIDTYTSVDDGGNLAPAGAGTQRITLDATTKNVLLDNAVLPFTQGRKEHDYVTLYDGSRVDKGFGGLLNAPGYHFSGYEDTDTAIFNNVVEDGDTNIWFFVTGNWVNMQAVYNLKDASGAQVWNKVDVPLVDINSDWMILAKDVDYPVGNVKYAANLSNKETSKIVQPGAVKIQVHFSSYDVGNKDSVKLYDATGALMQTYLELTDADGFWGPIMNGDTVTIKMSSDNKPATVGYGYVIDEIRYVEETSGVSGVYRMQSRLEVAKDALLDVIDEFRGKMNWGYAKFKQGGTNDGADISPLLNPTDNDDTQRAAIANQVNLTSAGGGTPLGEALQDVFESGYYQHKTSLDNLLCRKNYVIVVTDGYPSTDDKWQRIAGVPAFSDVDGDGWTSDPSQPPVEENFYDDVAHWLYTHSWIDKTVVTDPANSYVNVITHHIGFSLDQPLLEDAAKGKVADGVNRGSGGDYITAFNKQQLVAAFYSLALQMSQAVSFTAPVVSVDAVNKIQSGDDLYMGLFLPIDSNYWAGNVKKFKLGDGSTVRPERFMIYDHANNEAIDSTGEFLDNTAAFWGDDLDANDSDNYGAADIKEDGAGEVLLEDVQGFFSAATYWNRPIYTWKDGARVKFDRNNITATDLGVADDATRDKLINFTHGYTYDAIATTGAPLAVRDWILGPIIHSRPVVVDYFNTALPELPLLKRMIVVGSNDGMLHVFDDTTGREVFAFIPEDILPKLKDVQSAVGLSDTVDGLITLYRENNKLAAGYKNPKYLIFGERRGGASFWNLDVHDQNPLNWTVKWNYINNSEISESWSEVKVASIPWAITINGEKSYKDVAIFTGGYDSEEDFFPEPFTDQDSNGTPYMANGSIDNQEWSQATAAQDVYNDNIYNKYNPQMNERGRGIFVVDIDDPVAETTATLADSSTRKILPFSVTYGAASVTTGAVQTLPDMKFSFPASPSVVTGTDKNIYYDGTKWVTELKGNVLLSLYAVDVYANLFKIRLSFETTPDSTIPAKVENASWVVNKVFSANPGSMSGSGSVGGGVDLTDQGRKAFYPPAISWGGSKGFFEAGNYYFPDVTFGARETMASLFFGTGDRENPKYTMIRNRFYGIYDDSSVTAKLNTTPSEVTPTYTDVPVTSAPYFENDLLNLTCDELGKDSTINSCYLGTPLPNGTSCATASADVDMKSYLNSLLTDNAVYGTTPALEYGATHENDAKGWYIVLEDQGKSTVCSHVTYPTTISDATSIAHDNHAGEQVLSQALLYYGTLYFTSYQASISDPCNPQGNGFAYSINYLNGSAAYDLNLSGKTDLTDRYKKFAGIYGIPSGFTIITSDGHAAAMASMGGAIIGPGPDPDNPFEIDTPGLGLELFYWRDSNSQQP